MGKKTELTTDLFLTRPAWEIAKMLGLKYEGDSDCINHGGMFFDDSMWETYGYADAITITQADERDYTQTWLEEITILNPENLGVVRYALNAYGAMERDGKLYGTYAGEVLADDPASIRHWKICALRSWGFFDPAENVQTFFGRDVDEPAIAAKLIEMLDEIRPQTELN